MSKTVKQPRTLASFSGADIWQGADAVHIWLTQLTDQTISNAPQFENNLEELARHFWGSVYFREKLCMVPIPKESAEWLKQNYAQLQSGWEAERPKKALRPIITPNKRAPNNLVTPNKRAPNNLITPNKRAPNYVIYNEIMTNKPTTPRRPNFTHYSLFWLNYLTSPFLLIASVKV